MKILILQYWLDQYGGIESVNDTLASSFCNDENNVTLLSLWRINKQSITNKTYNNIFISDLVKRPSIKEMILNLKKLKFRSVITDLFKLVRYYNNLIMTFYKTKQKIKKTNADYIIVSSAELLKYIPCSELKKVFLHMHTSFDHINNEKKLINIVKKYQKKVNKIVWLTKKFVKEANQNNIKNSTYIYNPVKFKSKETSPLSQKQIIYIGRIAKEKRVETLVQIFQSFNLLRPDWKLKIVGSGNMDIKNTKNIEIINGTNDVKKELLNSSIIALTSSYEGFPMVLLEAFECGVPAIIFDFSSSSNEIMDNGNNGYIIKQNNMDEYINKLVEYSSLSNKEMSKLSQKVKCFACEFYPENIIKKWYKLFEGEY